VRVIISFAARYFRAIRTIMGLQWLIGIVSLGSEFRLQLLVRD
jgi:hypothetical protein